MKTPENAAFVLLNAEDFPAFNETEKMIDPGKQNKMQERVDNAAFMFGLKRLR